MNIWYYYNAAGSPVTFRLVTALYVYRKNLQGDITGVYKGGLVWKSISGSSIA